MSDGGAERLPRSARLRKAEDFHRVHRSRVHAADDVLVVLAQPSSQHAARLGLAVSRAVGNAVLRNRWKRLIREAFRRSRTELPSELDLIVKPRRGAIPELAAIRQSLVRLSWKLARRLIPK